MQVLAVPPNFMELFVISDDADFTFVRWGACPCVLTTSSQVMAKIRQSVDGTMEAYPVLDENTTWRQWSSLLKEIDEA